MILQIDVTVTGPGWESTGSAAVDVQDASAAEDNERLRQRSRDLAWGSDRA